MIEYNVGDKVTVSHNTWGFVIGKVYEIKVKSLNPEHWMEYKLQNDDGQILWVENKILIPVSGCHKCVHGCKMRERCPLYEESTPPS